MATTITTDCINCGACEPECPNNAISQGDEIFVIDPQLCTECVGFHDYEACAAVCPADCCITDPNNVETEEALIARARKLHQDVDFGESFESRFRKGEAKPDKAQPSPAAGAPDGGKAPAAQPETAAAQKGSGVDLGKVDLSHLALPDPGNWEITVQCFKCEEHYGVSASRFMIGNVLFCPHCFKSMVVKDDLNFQIRTAVKDSYDEWDQKLEAFQARREEQIKELQQKLENDLKALEAEREKRIQQVQGHLKEIAESYKAPGKPARKRSMFAWG